ncbi:MAG TPA: hypothetical protein VGS04_06765, partial [Nitrososphaerales archaeon]|nr:hypothetical protein [Nitrososphaerales archaeon]
MEAIRGEAVRVSIVTSKPPGGPIVVKHESFGARRPSGVGEESLGSPVFFDVFLDGVTEGSATVSISHDSITGGHRVHHWDGKRWVDHAERKIDGKTITAEF